MGFQKLSKTIKNPQSIQLFSFFERFLAPPKTIKKCHNPESTEIFPVFKGQSKTFKTPQKSLEYTVILIFCGISSSSKKPSQTSKTLRVYSYFPFLRGYQKPSKILGVYSYFHFLRGIIQLLQKPSKVKNPQSIQLFSIFELFSKTFKKYQNPQSIQSFPFLRGCQKLSKTSILTL